MVVKYIIQKWRYNPNVKRIIVEGDVVPNVVNEWLYESSFYAISPFFRPIPNGMNLFQVIHSETWPTGIQSIKPVYNFFDIYPQHTYFVGYNEPVPNTFKLDLSQLTAKCNFTGNENVDFCKRGVYVLKENIDKFECGRSSLGFPLCIPSRNGEELYKCMLKCTIPHQEKSLQKKL